MEFLSPSLHPGTVLSPKEQREVASRFQEIADAHRHAAPSPTPLDPHAQSLAVQLTTVSKELNFDSFVAIRFRGDADTTQLMVDSGCSVLVVPSWDKIKKLPGYTTLGKACEPFGSPAMVVEGPIEIPTLGRSVYTLEKCVFYACIGKPTAVFGAGRLTPWCASEWNTPNGIGVTLRAPLAYNPLYPFAEFDYAPATHVIAGRGAVKVATESRLVLTRSKPTGYTYLDTIPNLAWMSVRPTSLGIGGAMTKWPGDAAKTAIAMVDVGGGPVLVSDPDEHLEDVPWHYPVECPTWGLPADAKCISDRLTVGLISANSTTNYGYEIDTSTLPVAVQGLTLQTCKVNPYMMGFQGMNIGGISALFNRICVDYANGQVGMKPK